MKNMKRILLLPVLLIMLFSACSKEEPALPTARVVKLNIQGFAMNDTLEFLSNGVVLASANANEQVSVAVLLTISNDLQQIDICKKGTTEVIGNITAAPAPYEQQVNIFYDGSTILDNIELTPVSDPENMGFRIGFSTAYKHFYGGPVDIEIFKQELDMITFQFSYIPVRTIPNVTASFGEFIELPELVSTDEMFRTYVFKVYKAGTKELPYTAGADYTDLGDPEINYGSLEFQKGDSKLFLVDPFYYEDNLFSGYNATDVSTYFK